MNFRIRLFGILLSISFLSSMYDTLSGAVVAADCLQKKRSSLYPVPAAGDSQESEEVAREKKRIKVLLEKSLERCLKYRLKVEDKPLSHKQYEKLQLLKITIEQLQAELALEKKQEELLLKGSDFYKKCDEVLLVT